PPPPARRHVGGRPLGGRPHRRGKRALLQLPGRQPGHRGARNHRRPARPHRYRRRRRVDAPHRRDPRPHRRLPQAASAPARARPVTCHHPRGGLVNDHDHHDQHGSATSTKDPWTEAIETGPHVRHAEHDAQLAPDPHAGHGDHGAHGSHGGHDKHAGHSPEMFRDRFWLALVLTLPILYFSEQFQAWFGYQAIGFPGSEWVNPVLGTVLYLYGGLVFLQGARHELAAKQPGMMTLISLAITVAYGYSMAVALGVPGMP